MLVPLNRSLCYVYSFDTIVATKNEPTQLMKSRVYVYALLLFLAERPNCCSYLLVSMSRSFRHRSLALLLVGHLVSLRVTVGVDAVWLVAHWRTKADFQISIH